MNTTLKSTISFNLLIMMCTLTVIASCKNYTARSSFMESEMELVNRIAQYVSCPEDSIKMMLATSDSVCNLFDKGALENLDLNDKDVNMALESLYHKEIPEIVKVYGVYDIVTNFPTSESNAAFAWHEIANYMIAQFYEKTEASQEDIEKFFKVIDDILDSYSAGTQYDMNVSARRGVMLTDYRLISAYKSLYDNCQSPSLLKCIQASYLNLFEMYRERCEQIDGWWSDLPRQMARMQSVMIDERRINIEKISTWYKLGELAEKSLPEELDKLKTDVKWSIDDY